MCKVSVLIPAYNTERYIERCINSVLNQTLNDIEVIVINDGSKDGTKSILDKLDGSDRRLKIYHQDNKGIGASRKRALDLASGKYIQFIDSDDWVDNNFLMTMYSLAEQNNADIVEAGGFYSHDKNGEFTGKIFKTTVDNGIIELDSLDVAKNIVQRLHSCSLWTKLLKKEFCTNNNIYFVEGIDFGEDAHFICKTCFHKPKYIYTSQIFYHLLNNPTSTTKTRYTLKNFQCRIRWIEDLDVYCDDNGFKDALWSMKFFIKEEAALSGLFNQEQYALIFPEVVNHFDIIRVNPIRKLWVILAMKYNNQKVGSFANKPFVHFIERASNYIGRKARLFR